MDQTPLSIFLLYGAVVVQSFHTVKYEYYFINTAVTWHAAQEYCRTHYSDLVTFKDMDDIGKVTRPHSYFFAWIGLFDDPASWQGVMNNDSNSWRWSATGAPSPSQYMKWFAGHPNNVASRESCVYLHYEQWNDYPCHIQLNFACFNGTNDSSSKEFIFVFTPMTWEAARSYCRQHYTDLAMIEDEDENTVAGTAHPTIALWIGLYREPWRWIDGSNSRFTNWAPGQPDSGVQHCVVETSVHNWHDAGCTALFPFICQKAIKNRYTKVQLKLQTGADLSDPAKTALIIEVLSEKFMQRGLTDFRMQWTLSPQLPPKK